jgi:hypothetical protein
MILRKTSARTAAFEATCGLAPPWKRHTVPPGIALFLHCPPEREVALHWTTGTLMGCGCSMGSLAVKESRRTGVVCNRGSWTHTNREVSSVLRFRRLRVVMFLASLINKRTAAAAEGARQAR